MGACYHYIIQPLNPSSDINNYRENRVILTSPPSQGRVLLNAEANPLEVLASVEKIDVCKGDLTRDEEQKDSLFVEFIDHFWGQFIDIQRQDIIGFPLTDSLCTFTK